MSESNRISNFGARPLKRLIEEEIVDEIASLRLEEKIKEGDTVKIAVDKQGFEVGSLRK